MIKRFISRIIGFNNPSDYGALTTEEVEEIGRVMSEGSTEGIQKEADNLNSTYVTLDRPAEAGDFIRIVAAENTLGKYEEGDILVVDGTTKPEYIGVYVDDVGIPGSINPNGFIAESEYDVIEGAPLREEEEFINKLPTLDPTEILNDNLIRRIAELEDIVEMLTDDIVMLDERTHPLTREYIYGRRW